MDHNIFGAAQEQIYTAYLAHINGRADPNNLYNVLKSYDEGNTGILSEGLAMWQITYSVLRNIDFGEYYE